MVIIDRCFYSHSQCGYDDTSYACLAESQCCSNISNIGEVSKAVARFSSPIKGTSKNPVFVIPAKAGIQFFQRVVDPDFRRDDVFRGDPLFQDRQRIAPIQAGFGLPLLVLGAFLLDACGDGPVVIFNRFPEGICFDDEDCPPVGPCLGACANPWINPSPEGWRSWRDPKNACGVFWCDEEHLACNINNIAVTCDTDLKCCVPQIYADQKNCSGQAPNPILPINETHGIIPPRVQIRWQDESQFQVATPNFEICWTEFDQHDENFYLDRTCPDYAFSVKTSERQFVLNNLEAKKLYFWKVRHLCDSAVDLVVDREGAIFSPVQSFFTATNIMAQYTFSDNPFQRDPLYDGDQRCLKDWSGLLPEDSPKTLCDISGNGLHAVLSEDSEESITWIESSIFEGKGLFFSASTHPIVIPNDPLFATDQIAIEVFLNLRVLPENKLILAKRFDEKENGYSLTVDRAGLLRWEVYTSAEIYSSAILPLPLTSDSHIIAMANSESLELILNGSRIQNGINEPFNSLEDGGDILIGFEQSEFPKSFWQLDEINFYYGLSEAQLEQRLVLR